jgi:hypothetical protein
MASGEFKELIPFDRDLLAACSIIVAAGPGTKALDLQFPPIIESDGKSAKWDGSDQGAYEPIKTFNGSESRSLSIKLKYVVVGGKWTPSHIAQIGRDLRSYFYNLVVASFKGYPIVGLQLYDVVPSGPMTCRLHNVRTSHSGGIIRYQGGIFPLVTEHVLQLEAATRIGPIAGTIAGAFGPVGEAYIKLRSQALATACKAEWF